MRLKLRYREGKIEKLHEEFMDKVTVIFRADEAGNKGEAKALMLELFAILIRIKDEVKESSDHDHEDPRNCMKHFASVGTLQTCGMIYSALRSRIIEENSSKAVTLEDIFPQYDDTEVN